METQSISTQRWLVRNKFTDTDSNKAKWCRDKEVASVRAGAGDGDDSRGGGSNNPFSSSFNGFNLPLCFTDCCYSAAPVSPFHLLGNKVPLIRAIGNCIQKVWGVIKYRSTEALHVTVSVNNPCFALSLSGRGFVSRRGRASFSNHRIIL